ncbi:MAG: hypothetical protein M3680_29980 [Myxococcota bacterium]|nr:hypothetical protein [Myxococcota bacterium]
MAISTTKPAKPVNPDTALCTEAMKHASNHREELVGSTRCACFFCFRSFGSGDITSWIDKNQTALCPKCGIDSVVGTGSGHTLDDRFLRKMHQFHFGYRSK